MPPDDDTRGTPLLAAHEFFRRGAANADGWSMLIAWETQAVDYPRTDPGRPDHEPRGCPRGASFSWYTYSPARLRNPYIRGSLLERWRAAKAAAADPVAAFAQVAAEGGYRRRYPERVR